MGRKRISGRARKQDRINSQSTTEHTNKQINQRNRINKYLRLLLGLINANTYINRERQDPTSCRGKEKLQLVCVLREKGP